MGRILVVDDERSMREFLAICLKRGGHEVTVVESGVQAVAVLDRAPFDIVITDLRMPGDTDGIGVLQAVKARELDTEVVMVTAFATAETALSAMKLGAYDYLTKPFKVDVINTVIARALEKRSLVEANVALREQVAGRYRLASIIGKSARMQKLFALVVKIHSTKTSVLITGESGTGKELVARALHTEGNRGEAEFVAVNCGAIPDNLMESELFGHIKGAFTGAVSDKVGLIRRADKGTLFLDEIGELSLGLQVKLLRVLQERTVRPVGGEDEVAVDVRVLAATNRELEEEVARGAFRNDLYYRLNVIELRIPPLRQRITDIPLLAEHFLTRHAAGLPREIRGFTPQALRHLEQYDYPGNVRELENMIERAVTLADGPLIDVLDLPERKTPAPHPGEHLPSVFPEDGIDLDRAIADFERGIVEQAMTQAGGVRKRAAGLLGITFRSLRYRLAKLGLDTHDPAGENPNAK
ncbi:MAG: sigma-54-dependent Fis family transcriptional regulator [Myxococcales bacterium]|nr:sigma-54-dependent Fis family transcriptional regulator [Myxococcales bacterium]